MRGEDTPATSWRFLTMETPPHAWGRRKKADFLPTGQRNTPTCVGKTARLLIPSLLSLETPPHAWGRHNPCTLVINLYRNTPTCVGKTCNRFQHRKTTWKHPHMRGEDAHGSQPMNSKLETPPHAWGRLPIEREKIITERNTPTCVGKTRFGNFTLRGSRKHPHMRGEDLFYNVMDKPREETPPHAWGRRKARHLR